MTICEPCGKESFTIAAEARQALRAIRQRNGLSGRAKNSNSHLQRIEVYACEYGNGWHMGHHGMSKRQARTGSNTERAAKGYGAR